jgi:hypothetical protein
VDGQAGPLSSERRTLQQTNSGSGSGDTTTDWQTAECAAAQQALARVPSDCATYSTQIL